MTYENFERLLKAVYAEYLQLDDARKAGACERTLAILSRMIREKTGRKRKLSELEDASTKRWSCFFDHLAAHLRWIRVSH